MPDLQITCHCGAVAQTLTGVERSSADGIPLCHCYGCRHSTGQLFASYVPLRLSSLSSVRATDKLATFTAVSESASPHRTTVKLYFCCTCGCHVFRSVTCATTTTTTRTSIQVASGTLVNGDGGTGSIEEAPAAPFGPHVNVDETVDGGLSKWMTDISTAPPQEEPPVRHYSESHLVAADPGSPSPSPPFHRATCLCRRVSFRVHAPTAASLSPHSHFADLLVPFYTQDPEIQNPRDVKWWMRRDNTRFLAGTCACRSCRLVSGFEMQSWAFVPRVNITFPTRTREGASQAGEDGEEYTDSQWEVLDFEKLHRKGTLMGYESSPGVVREFCPGCGATVFWHDTSRPELIDVSAGLLVPFASASGDGDGDGREGVRVESLLEWWTDRVSFAEDAALGRDGAPRQRAECLVSMFGKGVASRIGQP